MQRAALWAASMPYGWMVRRRNRLFDQGRKQAWRASIPVFSVGNLTLGGTGKTPCVEYVAASLSRLGRRIGILSRGYGSADGLNDEALVLRQNLPDVPHWQGADRVKLARVTERALPCEALILDDGFQHRRLARDLDIVLVDMTNPWGYGYLFPRGMLREPIAGLRRAGAVVLTRCDQANKAKRGRVREAIAQIAPHASVAETIHWPVGLINRHGDVAPLSLLSGRRVAAFCGIGNPAAFQRSLTGLGAEVTSFRAFADHQRYSPREHTRLMAWAAEQPPDALIVTTQKDLVKLQRPDFAGRELWALRIAMQFESEQEAFDHQLLSVMQRGPTRRSTEAA